MKTISQQNHPRPRKRRADLMLILLLALGFGIGLCPTAVDAQGGDDPEAGEEGANPGDDTTGDNTADDVSVSEPLTGTLSAGGLPVLSFLKYIMEQTDLIVNFKSAEITPDSPEIEVLGDIEELNFEIIKSILEANDYVVTHEFLNDEQRSEVIHISGGTAGRGATAKPAPQVTKIHDVEDRLPTDRYANDRYATLVIELEHQDPGGVTQVLRELLGGGGGGGRGGGAAGVPPITHIPNTNTLVVKGKIDVLRHIQELVAYIDVEIRPPDPILSVVEVYNADAQELVDLITEILDVQSSGGRGTRTNRSRATARGSGRTSGQNTPSPRAQTDPDEYTRLIADPRTQKIIVDTTAEDQVDTILRLIDDLDVKVENLRPNTHHYEVKFLKASDLAEDINNLVSGTRSSGSRTSGRNARNRTGNTNQAGQQGQAHVVPHDDTNSLLIQAEYAEYLEILRVLEGIDRKRKQVFLEAALVQVTEGSDLNYTLEYLAGDLDETATRAAGLTSFGLSTPMFGTDADPTALTISRTITGAGTGLLAAVSRDGQLPVLLRAIKEDTDTKVLATPFILADDNETSDISSTDTIFFETSTLNANQSQSGQGSTDAGITLSLTPTISENVVLINLALTVSSFSATSSSETGAVPDRSENTINSHVTVADGELFIVGGLARELDSVSASKVPILGDLPLIGWLFQSKGSTKSRNNLYVFLNAHILRSDDFSELRDLSRQARGTIQDTFNNDVQLQFESPNQKNDRGFNDEGNR